MCILGQVCVGEWLSDGKNLKYHILNRTVIWELAKVDSSVKQKYCGNGRKCTWWIWVCVLCSHILPHNVTQEMLWQKEFGVRNQMVFLMGERGCGEGQAEGGLVWGECCQVGSGAGSWGSRVCEEGMWVCLRICDVDPCFSPRDWVRMLLYLQPSSCSPRGASLVLCSLNVWG